jgi:hypothetical protein
MVHDTCLYLLQFQAGLKPAVREKWGHSAGHRVAFHGLSVQDVTGFDSY